MTTESKYFNQTMREPAGTRRRGTSPTVRRLRKMQDGEDTVCLLLFPHSRIEMKRLWN